MVTKLITIFALLETDYYFCNIGRQDTEHRVKIFFNHKETRHEKENNP